MKLSKIRWTGNTWNFFTGCTKISPGCDHCYAEVIATSPRFAGGFPNQFTPTFKPQKLRDPLKWKEPTFCFVNSMSDFMHKDFTDEMRDEAMDVMLRCPHIIFQILTKRAQALPRYVRGWLSRVGFAFVPKHIWFGVSIESDEYRFRADHLREVPGVRFISAEPLIAPASRLNLDGIHWLIVGGESGNGSNDFRPMPHDWALDLLDRARETTFFCPVLNEEVSPAYFFKQSSGFRTETGLELADLGRVEEYPFYPNDLTREEYVELQHQIAERVKRKADAKRLKMQQIVMEG